MNPAHQSNPWKIKTVTENGERLSALKPRRARLLMNAGLAIPKKLETGEPVLLVLPKGVEFIRSGACFDQLKALNPSANQANNLSPSLAT